MHSAPLPLFSPNCGLYHSQHPPFVGDGLMWLFGELEGQKRFGAITMLSLHGRFLSLGAIAIRKRGMDSPSGPKKHLTGF